MAENGLTLAEVRNIEGDVRFNMMMTKWMAKFVSFFSVCTMTGEQVTDTVSLMLESYPNYSIADIKLFFKQAKNGILGELYGRFDGNVILTWLGKYDKNRRRSAEAYLRQQRMEEQQNQIRNWNAYAQSEAFEANQQRATQGYQLLQKRLAESKFGLRGRAVKF
ncbi:DUF6633 family protein [Bacteroides sp. 519]|uniref:DUF6633 family protein n=1 Tax=Bacteroides sp. 519 TaxID=2302937 RepID=UPI0013D3441E|nr:DUF6633 family protein [Bacteroides sp. 519]NDV58943.1 hypothetical protein [Bacteroides sp. 519]